MDSNRRDRHTREYIRACKDYDAIESSIVLMLAEPDIYSFPGCLVGLSFFPLCAVTGLELISILQHALVS